MAWSRRPHLPGSRGRRVRAGDQSASTTTSTQPRRRQSGRPAQHLARGVADGHPGRPLGHLPRLRPAVDGERRQLDARRRPRSSPCPAGTARASVACPSASTSTTCGRGAGSDRPRRHRRHRRPCRCRSRPPRRGVPSGDASTRPIGIHENDASTVTRTSPVREQRSLAQGGRHDRRLHHLPGGDPYGGLVGDTLRPSPRGRNRTAAAPRRRRRSGPSGAPTTSTSDMAIGTVRVPPVRESVDACGVSASKTSVSSRVRTAGRSTHPVGPDLARRGPVAVAVGHGDVRRRGSTAGVPRSSRARR